MKHNIKVFSLKGPDIFTKKQKMGIFSSFVVLFPLSIFFYTQSTFAGVTFLLMSFIPGLFIFYKNCKKLLVKVFRIDISNNIPRFLTEYWFKTDVYKLDQDYFWTQRGKYIAVIVDDNGKYNPLYPFDKDLPQVTSGHLQRSLVQKATDVLMKPEKSNLADAIKTGGLMLLAAGGALVIISLFGRLTDGSA